MRRVAIAPLVLCSLVSCTSADDTPSTGTGGSSFGVSGAPSATGGASTGGAATSGGSTGGTVTSTGGASSGGTTSTGGSGASSGATTGGASSTGGASPAGGAGGSLGGALQGGSSGANTAGTAGAPQGGSAGGAGNNAGGGGGAALPTVAELFPNDGKDGALDGRLITMPCSDNASTEDCVPAGAYYEGELIPCTGGRLDVNHVYPVGGVAGKAYAVTFHFYGIVEPRDYGSGVMREATDRPGKQDTGAMPTPWAKAAGGHAYAAGDYDTYELRVADQDGKEVAAYYLNADTQQGHWTYVLNFSKQIDVIGGGQVRARIYDQNCKGIKNCGNPGTYPCEAKANARIIDVSKANPAPTEMSATEGGLLQPTLIPERNGNSAGQWLLIDVVSVDSMR